jgi:hypothetical protein
MTTLPIRAPIVPSLAGFAHVMFFVAAFFEVIADAQSAAAAAHKKYPFADW